MAGKLDPVSALAIAINAAIERRDVSALEQLIQRAAELRGSISEPILRANLSFSRANAHSNLRQILAASDPIAAWQWEDVNLRQEIYWLRDSLNELRTGKVSADVGLRLRVETNLGSALNSVGRFCEALDHWDAAIALDPKFGMALANRGYGLTWYARALYDPNHQLIFFANARRALISALEAGVEPHAVSSIQEELEQINRTWDWTQYSFDPDRGSLGRGNKEQKNRRWCLEQRLFINPLNDVEPHRVSAHDILNFPATVDRNPPKAFRVPEVYGIYNQLVQEFVSARYLMHEAIVESTQGRLHFSDREVLLYDTLDYRVLRLWVEKIKMAFLSSFAVFDKIAFLVNHYWSLGVPLGKVNFGSVWFKGGDAERGLRVEFAQMQNWPLRGLFALSRDLYWKSNADFPSEPQARLLHQIRSHIAHRYLTVHDSLATLLNKQGESELNSELSYEVTSDDLKLAAIKLLKLVRNGLIYVSLAAHWHETKLGKRRNGDPLFSMPLFRMGNRRL